MKQFLIIYLPIIISIFYKEVSKKIIKAFIIGKNTSFFSKQIKKKIPYLLSYNLKKAVTDVLDSGKIMLLDIDVQGGIQIRNNMPNSVRVFILPPSEDELLRRLETRGRDDEDSIQRRFQEAKREIKLAQDSGAYEYFIVNDDLQLAIAETIAIIQNIQNDTASTL